MFLNPIFVLCVTAAPSLFSFSTPMLIDVEPFGTIFFLPIVTECKEPETVLSEPIVIPALASAVPDTLFR